MLRSQDKEILEVIEALQEPVIKDDGSRILSICHEATISLLNNKDLKPGVLAFVPAAMINGEHIEAFKMFCRKIDIEYEPSISMVARKTILHAEWKSDHQYAPMVVNVTVELHNA